MKTKEGLNVLKAEVETLNKKLAELTGEELAEIFGGVGPVPETNGDNPIILSFGKEKI